MANEKQAIQDAIDAGEVYIDDDGQDATEVPAGIKLNKTLIGSKVTPHEVIDDEGNPTWHKHGMKTKHVRNLVTVGLSSGKTTTKPCSTFYKTVC